MEIKSFFKRRYDRRYSDTILFITIKSYNETKDCYEVNKVYFPKHEFDSYVNYFEDDTREASRSPRSYFVKDTISAKNLYDIYKINPSEKRIEEIENIINMSAIYKDGNCFIVKQRYEPKERLVKKVKSIIENAKINHGEDYCGDYINNGHFTLRLYNTGQACSSSLSNQYGIHSFFDLGSFRYNNYDLRYSLFKGVKKSRNTRIDIVISHYDNDHLNMIKYFAFDNSVNGKLNFILPYPVVEIEKLNMNSLILLSSIFEYKCSHVFLDLKKGFSYRVDGLEIFQGVINSKHRNEITDMNARCLITNLKTDNNELLVPGDSLYYNWPILFKPTILIIPHHGCDYDKEESLPNISLERLNETIVYAGPSKKYHHPNVSHLSYYKNNAIYRFYNPFQTRIFNGVKEVKDIICTVVNSDSLNIIIW